MRSLSPREGVAAMASTIVEHLNSHRRYEEAIKVLEIVLRHGPRDGMAWANLGNAYCKIVKAEFLDRYSSQFLIPLPLRPRYQFLLQRNLAAFATAKSLCWEPVE